MQACTYTSTHTHTQRHTCSQVHTYDGVGEACWSCSCWGGAVPLAATGDGTGEDLWELQLEVGVDGAGGLKDSEGWGEVVRLGQDEEDGVEEEDGAGEEEGGTSGRLAEDLRLLLPS